MMGHSGVARDEATDRTARKTRWVGAWIPEPVIATLAGIRQAFPPTHQASTLEVR